ncbi:MAG TPA: DNA ligase D [Geminicoccus sp.]|uniref:DNA ligase D n=1 Tax=Geminicoccus sp. TaxID=2024832 RepID=UPI002E3729AE|nr:DNA ligase D [Geminicoccus sp.]HEX2529647.1 DNA ligase D [Geminicoccus sp.]
MADLAAYIAKRDFTRTAEPKGRKARTKGHGFVIQKHAARRLHYDLRLELDGVLKSWAVARGPSLVAGEKRLAVEVEDHPLDYGDFEGTIPKGEYGAGSVIVWDRGIWKPEADPHLGLSKGRLSFELAGEKLHGSWHLVRMHRQRGEKRDNWLLIKQRDDHARPENAPDILEEAPNSVLSGRSNDEIGQDASPKPAPAGVKGKTAPTRRRAARSSARTTTAMPDFVPPCLATLEAKPPVGDRWLHEIKFDGYRIQARIQEDSVVLLTRSGLDWTGTFGSAIPAAFAALPGTDHLIDGEVVVEGEAGASDYVALREDLSAGRTDRFRYYAFDLLFQDGLDLRAEPLDTRKRRLRELLAGLGHDSQPLRFSESFPEQGDLVLQHACRLSLEGIVSKLRAAPYRSGRSGDWIKSKCGDRQEFVIVGWVPSTAAPRAIGSLVLAYYDDGKLVHAGRVGTGFGGAMARELWERLRSLDETKMPFKERPERSSRDVHWVSPQLVAEVEFRGWTGDLLLRHASFRGLRDDKPATEIVREDPAPARKASAKALPKAPAEPKQARVKLTHPDRVYWPEDGVTKQGLVDYYADIWKWMAPHVVARPLSLMRCPDGVGQKCFFQKSPWRGMNRAVTVLDNPGNGGDTVLTIQDLDGMVALVQGGVLEVHPWGVRIDDLDHPDQVTFDLDPGDDVDWEQVKQAAFDVRERLKVQGLESYLKTTGGKGLHVVVPLKPSADWEQAKNFAHELAAAMTKDSPALYTATMTKKLRAGRVFVDWLRNGRGSTAVCAYSTRARAGAPVSTPLAWDELDVDVRGPHFNVNNVANRLGHLGSDPWTGFFRTEQTLPVQKAKRAHARK